MSATQSGSCATFDATVVAAVAEKTAVSLRKRAAFLADEETRIENEIRAKREAAREERIARLMQPRGLWQTRLSREDAEYEDFITHGWFDRPFSCLHLDSTDAITDAAHCERIAAMARHSTGLVTLSAYDAEMVFSNKQEGSK